jgi:hypothetical protein
MRTRVVERSGVKQKSPAPAARRARGLKLVRRACRWRLVVVRRAHAGARMDAACAHTRTATEQAKGNQTRDDKLANHIFLLCRDQCRGRAIRDCLTSPRPRNRARGTCASRQAFLLGIPGADAPRCARDGAHRQEPTERTRRRRPSTCVPIGVMLRRVIRHGPRNDAVMPGAAGSAGRDCAGFAGPDGRVRRSVWYYGAGVSVTGEQC